MSTVTCQGIYVKILEEEENIKVAVESEVEEVVEEGFSISKFHMILILVIAVIVLVTVVVILI